jgi:hypothetical protein
MSDFKGLFKIRAYRESDKNFILSTFLKGLYYGNKFYNMIDKKSFMDSYKLVAQAMLQSPNVMIYVACLPDDPDVILGYSIVSKDHTSVAWVFVKTVWRQKGIGKSLLPSGLTTYTHFTDIGMQLINKLPPMIFNPWKIQL